MPRFGGEQPDGLHQAEGRDLLEVLERLAAATEALGDGARHPEVQLDHPVEELRTSGAGRLRREVEQSSRLLRARLDGRRLGGRGGWVGPGVTHADASPG